MDHQRLVIRQAPAYYVTVTSRQHGVRIVYRLVTVTSDEANETIEHRAVFTRTVNCSMVRSAIDSISNSIDVDKH